MIFSERTASGHRFMRPRMERFPAGWARSAPHLPGETNWVQIVDFPLWAVLRYRLPGSSERRGEFAKAFLIPSLSRTQINAWAHTFFAVAFI
jgi:hypothetical protein